MRHLALGFETSKRQKHSHFYSRYTVGFWSTLNWRTQVASASPTTREVQFDLPKSKTNHSDLRALVANIDLVDVPVPRVASFIAAGWRPSQPPRRYGVRMAPVHLLPARIMVTDHAGFNRCLSWATLPGSTLSIPRQAQNLTITVFLTEFVLSIPCEAPDVRFSWTEHLKTSLSCKDLCEDDADCLSSFTAGKNGCFFAKHHHSFHERSCGSAELVTLGGPKAMNSHALLSRLNGCIGNGRSCGTAVIKNVSTLSFEPVLPDWQADGQGTLDFSLALTTGGTETVSQVAKVSLRQGLPFASDVLVHLEAQTLENTSKTIPAYGNVSSAGDITITVTQYDPLELQMGRIMRMTLAPVLPDRLFQVIWLTEQPSAVSAPHFQRCEESSLLRTRLKACNGSSDWLVEPFTTSVSRFFPGEERSNIQFVVETKDADEHKLWPEKLVFSVSVRFVAVDAPAAWSAEKGCSVVQAWDQQEVFEAFIKSPDAFCRILDQGCHDRSKFAGIEKNIRKAFSAYFVRDFNRFRLVTFEQQVQGYVCAYEYGAMGPDENRTFQSTRAWTYVPNEGLGGFESWDAPKSKFNYLRVDDFNGYVYNVPIIPLPIFLQSIARMSTSRPSALNFLSALCQATMRKYNRSEVIEDGVFSWIEASVDTGNMNVTSVVLQCLDRLKGGRFGGNQAKRLARAVWSQTSRRAAEGAPMPFELARLVSSWRDVEVLKEVVSLLVQNQRGKWFPQLLAAFGGSSALQQWDSWDVSIQESALLGELAAVLQCTRELKRLSVHASASVKALPLYMMRTGGLVQAFRGLNNLKFLNFGPMLGETTGSFTEAISHLPLVKLVVRGMRLSECGPLAGMQLQIVCLQSWKESDFQLSAEAYSSNLHWTRLHLQLMGSLSLADTAALLHRLVKLELLTIEIHEVPTRDEWKDFLGAVRGMPSLKELLIRGNNGQPCLPSDKKEVAPEFERLPQSMTTIMFDQCLDRNKACGILKHHLPEQIQCKESGFKFCDHPTANLWENQNMSIWDSLSIDDGEWWYTSRTGQAGGGSSKREEKYKPKKDFAYKLVCDNLDCFNLFLMTRTKLASVGFVAERNCMRQQVLDSAKSLPNCGRSDPQRHATLPSHEIIHISTLCYKLLRRTTKYYEVLLRTTNYYQSATPYYKALLQYYKVLQSTTPVLFCTTLYYKVLLRYYSVLQSTTPYYPVLQCTTPVLLCATKWLLKYYSVLLRYYSVLLHTTLYFKVLLQYYAFCIENYNMSRSGYLPKFHHMLRLHETWHCNIKCCACHEKWCSNVAKYCTCHVKVTFMIDPRYIWNVIYIARSNRCRPKYCAYKTWLSSLIRVTHETSLTMRGATWLTLQPHQILRLPRKMTRMIDAGRIWNNAQSNRHHPPISPNTAPATQNCTPKST